MDFSGGLIPLVVDVNPLRGEAIAHVPTCPLRTEHRDSPKIYRLEFDTREKVEEVLEEWMQQGFEVGLCGCVETRGAGTRSLVGLSGESNNDIPLGSLEPIGENDRLFRDSWWFRKNTECELQFALARLSENAHRLALLPGRVNHQVFAAMRKQCKADRASIAALKRRIATLKTEPLAKSSG